jgi:3-dehydroquinate synthetase
VRIGAGAAAEVARLAGDHDRVALVSCARVLRTPFGRAVAAALEGTGKLALRHQLPDGERGKTLEQLELGAVRLLRAGCTRRSLVVALGGGAVADAAGFLAATFMRGVAWAALPTTLLAMVDAALGGKTAANLPGAKNAVGAFHPPVAVLADPASLASLPGRELRSGFAEVLKYAALRPGLLPGAARQAAGGEADPLLVASCAAIKLAIVERDPEERGERKLLNLGHTFGHGVEAAGGFARYSHGESVAIGLRFAFLLAAGLGRIGPLAVAEVTEALQGARLPVAVPPPVARRAARLMGADKKRTEAGLRWVLPRARGPSWTVDWDVVASEDALRAAIAEIGREP